MSVNIRGNSRRSTGERQMLKRTIATPGMYIVSREAIRIVRGPALVRPIATTAPHAANCAGASAISTFDGAAAESPQSVFSAGGRCRIRVPPRAPPLGGHKPPPALPQGDVSDPAAPLLNPPHRLALGREQQDRA